MPLTPKDRMNRRHMKVQHRPMGTKITNIWCKNTTLISPISSCERRMKVQITATTFNKFSRPSFSAVTDNIQSLLLHKLFSWNSTFTYRTTGNGLIIIIIIISNYIKVRPKASGAGLVCRTEQYFQCQRLTYTCRIKTVKSVR